MTNIISIRFTLRRTLPSFLIAALSVIPAIAQSAAPDSNRPADRATVNSLLAQGIAQLGQRTPDAAHKAIATFEQALAISQSLKDPGLEAQADSGLAFAHLSLHENDQALPLFTKARDLAQLAGNKPLEASSLVSLGVFYQSLGEYPKAISFLQQGEAAWHSIGNAEAEAKVFSIEAFAYSRQKDLPHEIAAYEQSLTLFRVAKSAPDIAQTLLVLGQKYNQLQQPEAFQKAATCFAEAAPLFHSAGKFDNEANAWFGLAAASDRLSHPEQARTAYLNTLALFDDPKSSITKIPAVRGNILLDIAMNDDALQNHDEAIDYYRRAIPLLDAATSHKQEAMAQVRLGNDLSAANQRPAAIEAYKTAIALSDQHVDDALHALAQDELAFLYRKTGERAQALELYKQALALQQTINDRVGELNSLTGMNGIYEKMGDAQDELQTGKQALDLVPDDQPAHGKAVVLLQIGDAYNRLNQTEHALEYLNRSLVAYGDDPAGREIVLAEIGEVYATLGDMKTALKYSNQALEITHTEHTPAAEQKVLADIAQIYWWLGDLPSSIAIDKKNLAAARDRKDVENIGVNLNNLALVYSDAGDSEQAEPLFLESLDLARQRGDHSAEATTLSGLGMAYYWLGHEQQAIDTLNQALAIERDLKDPHGEAIALDDLGVVYEGIGEPQRALEAGNQAVSLLKDFGDEPQEAIALNSMGATYHRLGIYDRAADYFQQSFTIDQRIDDPDGQMRSLNNLAVLAEEQHDKPTAIGYYNQSLAIARKLNNRGLQAYLLATIAMAETGPGAALKVAAVERTRIESALQTARAAGDINDQALATYNLGVLMDWQGHPAKALPYLRQAISLWKSCGNVASEKSAQSQIAREERKLGHLEAALSDIDKAIHLDESQRSLLKSDTFRASYFSTANSDYTLKIGILMDLHHGQPDAGYGAKALATSEQARARSLLDLLSQSHAVLQHAAAPGLIAQAHVAENTLNAKEAERARIAAAVSSPGQQAEVQRIDEEIQRAAADFANLQDKIRIQSPAYARLTQPLTLTQIRQQVLDPGSILLEYSLGEQHSYLFAVTLTSLTAYVLPPRAQIERSARDFYDLISGNNQDLQEIERTGRALTDTLLGPIAAQLGHARLIIVGDGKLQEFVPFAALPSPNSSLTSPRPLIADHEILTEPSASAVAILRQGLHGRAEPSGAVAVFADPVFQTTDPRLSSAASTLQPASSEKSTSTIMDASFDPSSTTLVRGAARETGFDSPQSIPRLPHTREEATSILSLTNPAQSFQAIGFDATKAAASNPALANYRIVHFATHGFLDAGNPDLSGIVLSLYDKSGKPIDGFLRLNDIFALKLPVDLVVLSACESGQGQLVTGEGLMGLTRGFFHAGAASLAVSLWSVDDAATAELMSRFYKGMLGPEKQTPAAALRAAQLSMAADPKWAHPFFWAPFTVEGEWHQNEANAK
jgi:CHAT domain-containing protein